MVAENKRDELARLLYTHDCHVRGDWDNTKRMKTIGAQWSVDGAYEQADAILSSSWLAGQLKQARADAWEEGYSRCHFDQVHGRNEITNPYAN